MNVTQQLHRAMRTKRSIGVTVGIFVALLTASFAEIDGTARQRWIMAFVAAINVAGLAVCLVMYAAMDLLGDILRAEKDQEREP